MMGRLSPVDRGEFWWNPKRPDEPMLWQSKIRLGEDFFNEIIRRPVPLDLNTLTALKRSTLGLDLYLWIISTAPLCSSARYGSLGVSCTVSSEWNRTKRTTVLRSIIFARTVCAS